MKALGSLADHFEGIAWKRLTAVEVEPARSNQHEFQGVQALRELLGTGKRSISAQIVYLADGEEDGAIEQEGILTWYDAREKRNKQKRAEGARERSPEYHLYYSASIDLVPTRASVGDLLVIAARTDGSLLVLICAAGSVFEAQICWLFGIIEYGGSGFLIRKLNVAADRSLDVAERIVLEAAGIGIELRPTADPEELVRRFGDSFPKTAEFSSWVRDRLNAPDLFREDPDEALMECYRLEEDCFLALEQHIVGERIRAGFESVEDFLRFSMSIHQRRRSRAGLALEHHLRHIFDVNGITYEVNVITEPPSKPDFLFPGKVAYEKAVSGDPSIHMLAVKTTCKDRWRQVLAEAAKIPAKHLFTLEPGISRSQTDEMQRHQLRLVLPRHLHSSYTESQRIELLRLSDFIRLVGE